MCFWYRTIASFTKRDAWPPHLTYVSRQKRDSLAVVCCACYGGNKIVPAAVTFSDRSRAVSDRSRVRSRAVSDRSRVIAYQRVYAMTRDLSLTARDLTRDLSLTARDVSLNVTAAGTI